MSTYADALNALQPGQSHTKWVLSTTGTEGVQPQFLFAPLFYLAAPVLEHYAADLYHDARWIAEYADEDAFYWSVNEVGTCIGSDPDPRLHRDRRYCVQYVIDHERYGRRHKVTVTRLA